VGYSSEQATPLYAEEAAWSEGSGSRNPEQPRVYATSMRMKQWAACVLAAAAVGCQAYTLSFRDKEPLEPLPVYVEWWAATETCSGQRSDLGAIKWYTALTIATEVAVARGVWVPPHEITIVRGFEDDEVTVRHEMLHDLLGGDSDHTEPEWAACGLIPT